MSLTGRIQALINYANETTEAGDTTLGDAVKTLCDGYGGSVLPAGYKECEYIESTGTQYIDTPVIFGTFTHDIEFTGSARMLMGGSSSAGQYWGAANSHSSYELASARINLPCNARRTITYVINQDKSASLTVDGTTVTASASGSAFWEYRIFQIRSTSAYCSCKIYSFKCHADGRLVLDFLPALDPDGRPCMYDKVSNQPYYNQGTGEFFYLLKTSPSIAPSLPTVDDSLSSQLAALLAYANETTGKGDTKMGDAIRTLCEGYSKADDLVFYDKLITDGKAVIRTDYYSSADTTKSIRAVGCIPQDVISGTSWVLLGARVSSSVSSARTIMSVTYQYGRTSFYCKINLSTNPYIMRTGTYVGEFDARAYIDEDELQYISLVDTTGTYNTSGYSGRSGTHSSPISFFADNYMDREFQSPMPADSYLRKVEIVDDIRGTLTYVPCTYKGEPGLWEMTEGKFFGNANSEGSFSVENELVFYDRLVGDGVAYINTGFVQTGVNNLKEISLEGGIRETPNANAYYFFGSEYSSTGNHGKTLLAYYRRNLQGRLNNRATRVNIAVQTSYAPIDIKASIKYKDSVTDSVTIIADGVEVQNGDISFDYRTSCGNYPFHVFGTNRADVNVNNNAGMYIRKVILDDIDAGRMELVPCTYLGEPGLWDLLGEKFYGNSNTEGTLTVEND